LLLPIPSNQLAVRVATVHDKRYYQQEPAYNEDRRYYGALRLEPDLLKRGNARTTLRAWFETGEIDANRPRSNTPLDALLPWFLTANREIRSPDGTLLGVMRPISGIPAQLPEQRHAAHARRLPLPANRDL